MFYWSAFVQALLTGYIFSLFKAGVLNEKTEKKPVLISSLRFFRPLFFFFLILIGISKCSAILINIILDLLSFRWNLYITSIVHSVLLIFLFVPYLIVQEEINLKMAFKHNFSLWKQNWRQILSFLLIIILSVSIFNYLLSPSQVFAGTYFNMIIEMAGKTLRLVFRLWIAASIMVFCHMKRIREDDQTETILSDTDFRDSLLKKSLKSNQER
ncbi:MAG: hypothetical protein JW957_09090 [Candidatus Omnitrophica bacterium]|nr:hypothetical protein [Candidatus Omnitrophota bacterium]